MNLILPRMKPLTLARPAPLTPVLKDIRNGLIFDLDFSAINGTQIYDISGQGHIGTISGALARNQSGSIPGISPRCLEFDGSDDVVTFTNKAISNNIAAFSCEALFYARSAGELNAGRIIAKDTSRWAFRLAANSAIVFFVDYDGADVQRTGVNNSALLNRWLHGVCTWSGSLGQTNINIYINGVEISYASGNNGLGNRVNDSGNNINVGGDSTSNREFDGFIALARIYNRVLTSQEARQRYFFVRKQFNAMT